MTDVVSRQVRARMMAGIRGSNTTPEVTVRKYFHAAGLRFRLHCRSLPGRPDIVLSRYKTVVFVHGCFWHRHEGCRYAYTPKSNVEFWDAKLHGNARRDAQHTDRLRAMGWNVIVIWECTVRNPAILHRVVDEIRSIRP
jgi:DNA mismatch endonuclease (patch repair protein)